MTHGVDTGFLVYNTLTYPNLINLFKHLGIETHATEMSFSEKLPDLPHALKLEAYSGLLLALYIVSGACSLPLWLMLARRLGKVLSWVLGSMIAVAGFFWAVQLGEGDLAPYMIICVLSGAALGADLALPAAIAADIIPKQERGRTASYFGIWSLINKLVLAFAAGLALPLLVGLDYQPGEESGLFALAICYAGIPSIIKLLAVTLLIRWRSSLEVTHATESHD